mgnify:CR=1 FL=1
MAALTINFSDSSKTPITISTGTVDTTSTSLALVGRNAPNYGQHFAEDFLHLLENFSYFVPPENPVEGQLWYNSTSTGSQLMINEGAPGYAWLPINGVYKGMDLPVNPKEGDIWVDTDAEQLKIYIGSQWLVVGPDVGGPFKSGPYVENILGNEGSYHYVIKNYLEGQVISISSKDSFTPAEVIDGFSSLVPGINLSNATFGNTTAIFNGRASSASALRVTSPSTAVISSNNFVRKDITQTLSKYLKIADDEGLKIGSNTSTFLLQKSVSDAIITNLEESSKIVFKIKKSGTLETILSLDGNTRGVGVNTLSPAADLDVVGTLQVSDDVALLGNAAISGNQNVDGNLTVGSDFYVETTSTLRGAVSVGIENEVANLSIITPATSAKYDLGSPDKPFRKIWVNDIGSNSTLFNIKASSAVRLSSTTTFGISGQVESVSSLYFNGTTGGLSKIFTTRLHHSAIDSQVSTGTVSTATLMLVSNGSSLSKVSKSVFLSDVLPNIVKPGTIELWGGSSVPSGYLACNGSSYSRTGPYNALYLAVGTRWGSVSSSTFKVPNISSVSAVGTSTVATYIIKY